MVKVHDLTGKAVGELKLPKVFSTPYRPDVIRRAVMAIQSHNRQPYGSDPLAGTRTSARFWGSRHSAHSMQNRELARGKRTVNTSPAQELRSRFNPHVRSGREAHPPKVSKQWGLKVNWKENRLATMSAIAATAIGELVGRRHRIDNIELPIVVTDDVQNVVKTSQVEELLASLRLAADAERSKGKKVRAGRGKMRGRTYKRKKSVLFVVSEGRSLFKAAKNLPGVDICDVKELNAAVLAPGTQPGRLTVWSQSAVKLLGDKYG